MAKLARSVSRNLSSRGTTASVTDFEQKYQIRGIFRKNSQYLSQSGKFKARPSTSSGSLINQSNINFESPEKSTRIGANKLEISPQEQRMRSTQQSFQMQMQKNRPKSSQQETGFQQSIQRQRSQTAQLNTNPIQKHVPQCSFGTQIERRELFPIPKFLQQDSEIRYNNYKKAPLVNQQKAFSMTDRTWRNYKVFQSPMVDEIYDNHLKQYQQAIYQDKGCLFQYEKQVPMGRIWFKDLHKSQKVTKDLDNKLVVNGKDFTSTIYEKNIVELSKITSRERPSTTHIRILKYNEDIFKNLKDQRVIVHNHTGGKQFTKKQFQV